MSAAKVKCLVWDLDNTLWQGILLESDQVRLSETAKIVVVELDRRGILQSIASRNDLAMAKKQLEELGLWSYFLAPEIGWNAKSHSLSKIAKALNLGLDSFAFIDDQDYELAEVAHGCPGVRCYGAQQVADLLGLAEFNPEFVTEDSARRRQMYQLDLQRNQVEESFQGPRQDFLRTLDMVFTIRPAHAGDLERAYELTVRTNQLNTTGRTYSVEELERLRHSPEHLLLVAELEDKFGPYGKVGLALVELGPVWTIRLLLMSCRVVGRGVGSVFLHRLMEAAFALGKPLRADFKANGRNDMMLTTYRFAGFRTLSLEANGSENSQFIQLQVEPRQVPPVPSYLTVVGGFSECLAAKLA